MLDFTICTYVSTYKWIEFSWYLHSGTAYFEQSLEFT